MDLTDIEVLEISQPPSENAKPSLTKARRVSVKPAVSPSASAKSDPSNHPEGPEDSEDLEAQAGAAEAFNVGAVNEAPRVLREKRIPYPTSARRAGIEGVVELKLVINQRGRVESAELVRGPGYGLNEAALEAIKEFIFSPAKIGENTVAVRILYKYRFVLGGL